MPRGRDTNGITDERNTTVRFKMISERRRNRLGVFCSKQHPSFDSSDVNVIEDGLYLTERI